MKARREKLAREAAWLRPEPLVVRKALTDLRGAVAPKFLRDRYVYSCIILYIYRMVYNIYI